MSAGPDTLRVVVVDDEPLARKGLREALAAHSDVEVVGEARDGPEAVEVIDRVRPDAVFLDVRMPAMDGFQVLDALALDPLPLVVFVTAHDDHAVRAFDVHALDYLVKPFDDERLARAVERLRESVGGERRARLGDRVEALLAVRGAEAAGGTAPPAGGWHTRIQVRTDDRIRFVDVAGVRWIEADGNHVVLHLEGGGSERIRHTLKDLVAVLDPSRFVRVHRSTVLNLAFVREVQPWFSGDYVALLQGGEELRVSRHYRDGLLRRTF